MYTLKEVEEKLRKSRKIFLQGYVHKSETPIQDFIKQLVGVEVRERPSVYSRGGHQCYPRRNRSLGDLYKMTVHYYPELTLREFKVELLKLAKDGKIYTGYCPTIRKMTYFAYYPITDSGEPLLRYGRIPRLYGVDEYGMPIEYGLKEEEV